MSEFKITWKETVSRSCVAYIDAVDEKEARKRWDDMEFDDPRPTDEEIVDSFDLVIKHV